MTPTSVLEHRRKTVASWIRLQSQPPAADARSRPRPVAPVSPAYSVMSQDHAKLRYVFDLIKPGLVFVQKGSTWEPRVLRLGIANYDFTEVQSGLEEGEKVALMSAAIMQLRRQQQADRMKSMASPLGGSGGPGIGGGGQRGGPPGGGRGGN